MTKKTKIIIGVGVLIAITITLLNLQNQENKKWASRDKTASKIPNIFYIVNNL